MVLRDYFNSPAQLLQKRRTIQEPNSGRSDVQVKKENEKFTVVRSRSPQNLKCVISRCCFAGDGKEMYQNVKRTRTAIVFAHETYCYAALSFTSPSSLLKLPNIKEWTGLKLIPAEIMADRRRDWGAYLGFWKSPSLGYGDDDIIELNIAQCLQWSAL